MLYNIIRVNYNKLIHIFEKKRNGLINVMEKQSKRVIALLSGICLWIFFIFQEELSYYGLYTIVSYSLHEIASLIPLLCIGTAIIWCGYLMVKLVKRQGDRYDMFFMMILLVIIFFLGRYIYWWSDISSVSDVATIERVDRVSGEITIKNTEGQSLTLQSPELINRLLETDGQEYLITYDANINSEGKQRVQMITLPED